MNKYVKLLLIVVLMVGCVIVFRRQVPQFQSVIDYLNIEEPLTGIETSLTGLVSGNPAGAISVITGGITASVALAKRLSDTKQKLLTEKTVALTGLKNQFDSHYGTLKGQYDTIDGLFQSSQSDLQKKIEEYTKLEYLQKDTYNKLLLSNSGLEKAIQEKSKLEQDMAELRIALEAYQNPNKH